MQKGHLTLPSSLQVNKTYRRSANPAGARENGTAPPARPGSRRWQEDRQLAKRAAPGILKERSEEHTSELQSLMRISYAVFCLKKKTTRPTAHRPQTHI